jgi:(E)-4-hydroxy-3-methylbut-2-enyl-diphosphate synthase
VSLSEDPENEIPVAAALVNYISQRADTPQIIGDFAPGYNPIEPKRRKSVAVGKIGGLQQPVVISPAEITLDDYILIDTPDNIESVRDKALASPDKVVVVTTTHPNVTGAIQAMVHTLDAAGVTNPIIPLIDYKDAPADDVTLMAAADFGTLLLNGITDGIWLKADLLTTDEIMRLSLGILQATRLRISRTEYIACPGCGRTLFDLQSTLKAVKEATSHLKGLKIGVMGCIVNGPGEMADADYGYVGAASGNVSLYKGKECVKKNIPQSEAIPLLIDLIKTSGDWKDA